MKKMFYSDKSPIRKAWEGLWDRPKVTVDEAIGLNKDFLDKFYTLKVVKENLKKELS